MAHGARPHRGASLSLSRGELALLLVLVVLTAGAWALTIHQARTMDMPMGVVVRGAGQNAPSAPGDLGMAMPPATSMGEMAASGMSGMGWSWDAFLTFLLAWSVMMAAMMFPAAAPMILLFHKVAARGQVTGRAFAPTWLFTAGYLLVWIGIGAATWAAIQLASDLAGRLGVAARDTWAPLALGAILIAAGLYQFTPLKAVCLRHCQSPMGFVMTHWREGRIGALRMGVAHGAYCLGCCWMLFAVLVAAGVMSLAWMLVLTLVVFAEKVLPLGSRAVAATGIALICLGLVVAMGAATFPWSA
ncbi:MAG TPA: DUF2182 domain-containing protein [Thermomicrobiales bacterium]|jgi:predicted metal-binding membrane protein|nr:DUF2182 domain-containing protein [Thermomicrobiales bacterium]